MILYSKVKNKIKKGFGLFAASVIFVALGTACNPGLEECDPIDPFCNMDLLAMYGLLYKGPVSYQSKYLLVSHSSLGVNAFKLDPSSGVITQDLGTVIGYANSSTPNMMSDSAGRYLYLITDSTTALNGYEMFSDDTFQQIAGFPITLTYPLKRSDINSGKKLVAVTDSAAAHVLPGGTTTYYGDLYLYDWDPQTGSLIQRADSPLGLGCVPGGPFITPDGMGVITSGQYIAGPPYGMMSFFRNDLNSNFAITPGSPSAFGPSGSTTSSTRTDVISPDGRYYYYYANSSVARHIIDPVTKEVTYSGEADQLVALLGAVNTYAGKFTPDGKYYYSPASTQLVGVSWNSADGTFNSIPGLPYVLGGINNPVNMEMDPTGKFIYIAGDDFFGGGVVQAFEIQADGTLVPNPGGSFVTPFQSINEIHVVTEEQ